MSHVIASWHLLTDTAHRVGVPIDTTTDLFVRTVFGESTEIPDRADTWERHVIAPARTSLTGLQDRTAAAGGHWEGEAYQRFAAYADQLVTGASGILDLMDEVPRLLGEADEAVQAARRELVQVLAAAVVALAAGAATVWFFGVGAAAVVAALAAAIVAIGVVIGRCQHELSEARSGLAGVLVSAAHVQGLAAGGPVPLAPQVGQPERWRSR